MGTKNDVFGLENVYGLQIEGEWASKSDVWQTASNVLQDNPFGYWAGGMEFINGNTYVFPTSISRLDYSNDTNNAITRGFLHDVNASHYTTLGNSNFGYWAGGHPYIYGSTTPSTKSNIQRLEFGNDTNSTLIRSNLEEGVRYSAGSGNNVFGYVLGGVKDTEQYGPKVSLVQRISYANDTASISPKGPLGDIRGTHSAVPSGTNAYIAGGVTGEPTTPTNYQTTIERLDFSNDTASTSNLGDMQATRTGHFGTGNTTSAYWSGGTAIGLPATNAKKSERLDYSSDTSNTVYKGSTSIQLMGGGSAGSTTGGYFGGGSSTTPGVFYSSVYRLDYSSDTSNTVGKGNIGNEVLRVSACSSQGNGLTRQTVFFAGNSSTTTVPTGTNWAYFAGGNTNPGNTYHSDIQAIDMKNDTFDSKNKTSMMSPSPARSGMMAVGNNDNGYFCGGYHPSASPSFLSDIRRLDYSNDTTRSIVSSSVFPLHMHGADGASNLTYGYLFGGIGTNNTKFMRIEFSNETTTLMPSGSGQHDSLQRCKVTGNQSYAWITGGYFLNPTTTVSTVEKFDFSNDSAALSPHAALIKERDSHNASGNLNFGYFGGGQYTDYVSSIDRIDYSNDTVSQIATMSSPSRHSYSGSTGNSSGGYYAGGRADTGNNNDDALIRRIDYSNDTENPILKGSLIEGNMGQLAGLSAHENGLPETRNDRYEYRAFLYYPITAVDGGYGASNNSRTFDVGDFRETYNSGYIIGGDEPGSTHAANMERLDFTNDTARLQTRGNVDNVRSFSHFAGNENFFYQMGGVINFGGIGSYTSNIYRVSYANDTQFTNVSDLDEETYEGAAVSTRYKAYVAGGREGNNLLNNISKLNFSNETASTAITANLYQARTFLDGTSNDSYGYFGGGTGIPVSVPAIMSTVDRLDFSSDTSNTVNKGSLLEDRSYGLAACGNRYYGYFGGGYTEPGIYHSFISRVDYASDTTNNPARGPLTAAAYQLAATSNSDYGYFMTGSGPGTPTPYLSTTQRLDFSNDTADTVVKGACNYSKNDAGGVSAREHGLAQMGADIVRGPATAYNESVEQTP